MNATQSVVVAYVIAVALPLGYALWTSLALYQQSRKRGGQS